MKPKLKFAIKTLDELKRRDLYRTLRYGKINGPHIMVGSKKLVNFCSNDYLGLSAAKISANQLQSSSRLVSGNDISFRKLEEILAKHKSQDSSLVFPTGYMANLGAISSLAGKNDIILSDELNHASIIEACKLSGAKTLVYKHNNTDDLAKKLRVHRGAKKFIITEGIFSMDGDFAPLDRISEISEKHNAISIIDDAHGDFVIGDDGKGSANYFGVAKKIDIYISSLSKGLGSFGGYVASDESVVDLCINRARSFIYTSALPSFLVDMSLHRIAQNREKRRKKLEQNISMLCTGLKKIGYDIKSTTHIIPIVIGAEKTTMNFGKYLYNNGIFAQPIRYPTVPKNSARIRVSVTAWLSKKHIESALDVFEKAGKKFRIL